MNSNLNIILLCKDKDKMAKSEYLSSSPSTARLLCRGQFQDIGCVLFDCTTIPSCCSASMGKQKQTSVFEYCPFFVGFVLVVLDLRVCLQRLAAHDKKLSKKKTPNKRQKKRPRNKAHLRVCLRRLAAHDRLWWWRTPPPIS